MLHDAAPDVRFELQSPGYLSEEGEKLISSVLSDWYGIKVPADFNWSKNMARGGRINRRLSKMAHDEFGIKIPAAVLEEMGNIYEKYYVPDSTFFFNFSGNFNWERGDFGDPRSCFFGGSRNRHILRFSGAYAAQFHRQKDVKSGFARAWCLDTPEGTLVFNAYGMDLNRISGILSNWAGMNLYYNISYEYVNFPIFTNGNTMNLIAAKMPEESVKIALKEPAYNWELPKHSEY